MSGMIGLFETRYMAEDPAGRERSRAPEGYEPYPEYAGKEAGVLTSATSGLTFRVSSIYGPRFLTGLGRGGDCRFDGFF